MCTSVNCLLTDLIAKYSGGIKMIKIVCKNIMVPEGQFGQTMHLILVPPKYITCCWLTFKIKIESILCGRAIRSECELDRRKTKRLPLRTTYNLYYLFIFKYIKSPLCPISTVVLAVRRIPCLCLKNDCNYKKVAYVKLTVTGVFPSGIFPVI